ncbi:hypothetical protein K435DRAFT_811603 [Dendrothele bispora CBS 962.96]|uniref:Uncharacterized protein n=1 Tax=Dendrothele bispora (strain CBS 962.96) TaxID=1314807 RepID=A0A4V4HB80_DENBC|nr:hypothetical protein K435DRAFT_811603 [Dendrothele bispora CBS 962.96]
MNLAWNDVIYLDPIPTLEVSFHYVQYGHHGETAITSLVFKVTKPEPLGSNPRLPARKLFFHYVQHGQHGETVITSSVFEVTNQEVLGSNPRLPDKRQRSETVITSCFNSKAARINHGKFSTFIK